MYLLLEDGTRLLAEDGGALLLEATPPAGPALQLESGDYLLLEDGSYLLTETPPAAEPSGPALLLETGGYLLTEAGEHLLLEDTASAVVDTGGGGNRRRRINHGTAPFYHWPTERAEWPTPKPKSEPAPKSRRDETAEEREILQLIELFLKNL